MKGNNKGRRLPKGAGYMIGIAIGIALAIPYGIVMAHQQVTIGYDVSRKLVEHLLLDAAQRSEGLLAEPKPFVLVRDLNNNYVTYEINGYTDKTKQLVMIYSSLMESTLDRFDKAGVEILSPQHITLRDSTPTVRRHARRAN